MTNPPSRAKKGSVVIQTYKGRLRLQLPRQLYDGNRKYMYLNLADTAENWKLAEAKAQLIESDIKFERFDPTLSKYKPQTHLTVIETINPQPEITFSQLFVKYLQYKKPTVKETTFNYLVAGIQSYVDRCPHQAVSAENALQVRQWLLDNTTSSMCDILLRQLSTVWRRLLSESSYCFGH